MNVQIFKWPRPKRRLLVRELVLAVCALALGLGILITAIFPTGCLLFLVAFLLIGCGCGCMRR